MNLSKCKIILFFIAVLVLVSCEEKSAQKIEEKTAIPVQVREVKLQDIAQVLEYVGNIKAKDEAIIYPKVNGKVIEKVKEDGALISKGEAIVYLDRDEVGLKYEKAPVESTLNGIIGRVYVDIGSQVDLQTSIALVVSMDKVKIDLDVPEKYLAKISIGQTANVNIDAYPDEEFTGHVTKISPVIDLDTRTAPVEVTVDNPEHRLKSGMFAKVKLIIQSRQKTAVILKEAIIGKDPETYVFTVKDNKASLKKITLGFHQDSLYEVKDGLAEGDLVVIMGQQRLKEGDSVNPEK
ncbi:MAG: efflux RND transporter periplasmic adaptor subunit [Candidatus Omnitrophica bacterium]|jgi:multidrug efflux pump subunit AcrA (membrane-fusion protein)|nr:efflux RND transporter periplasmic adaptor subunit [Candidatus Omnitrophota bacterium]